MKVYNCSFVDLILKSTIMLNIKYLLHIFFLEFFENALILPWFFNFSWEVGCWFNLSSLKVTWPFCLESLRHFLFSAFSVKLFYQDMYWNWLYRSNFSRHNMSSSIYRFLFSYSQKVFLDYGFKYSVPFFRLFVLDPSIICVLVFLCLSFFSIHFMW